MRSFWLPTEFNVAEFVAKHATITMELKDALHQVIGTGGSCVYACRRIGAYNQTLQSEMFWPFSYAYLIQRKLCLDSFFVFKMSKPSGNY